MWLHPVQSERLRELELEHQLAMMGLGKGIKAVYAAILSAGFTVLGATVALVMTSATLLSGTQLVITFGILATAVILYFALVFGRAAKIKAEMAKERTKLSIELGRKVR